MNILKYILLIIVFSVSFAMTKTVESEDVISKENHLVMAKKSNSETWTLLQKETLSEDEQDQILYSAYASAYHWSIAGTLVHIQRAEWLISRVYSKLNNGRSALEHADKCLSLTNESNDELQVFGYAYAYEAMARAYALTGDFNNAKNYYLKAINMSDNIKNPKTKSYS